MMGNAVTLKQSKEDQVVIYAFGDYELDTQRYELRCAGTPLKIEPQVFNVLAYLIEQHDRTVTREELLDKLWPEQFTSEAVVSYCIMTARKAVGDSGRAQKVIKTLHGRGFRFIAPIEQHGRQPLDADTPMVSEKAVSARIQGLEHRPVSSDIRPFVEIPPVSDRDVDHAGQLVTVLCATLINASSLSEKLGFAGFQRLRQAFFALSQDVARRYDGTLQFFGADGILILFGAPVVCEDHAHQALRAALELQENLCKSHVSAEVQQIVPHAVRLGLHTGTMDIERIPKDQRIAATEMGETMHLAVWMQYLAEPGTLLIGEATMRQVRDTVPGTTSREINIPGQSQPIRVYVRRQAEG